MFLRIKDMVAFGFLVILSMCDFQERSGVMEVYGCVSRF